MATKKTKTMKVRLASDLHLNHYTSSKQTKIIDAITSTQTPHDVLCLAGDISEGERLIGHLRRIVEASSVPVVFVLGNHDHSRIGRDEQLGRMFDLAVESKGKFDHLRAGDEARGIEGCTWWYEHTPDVERIAKGWGWYDYKYIPDHLTTWPDENARERMLFKPRDGAIVMTHMLPSYKLVHPTYRQDASNLFFVQERGEEIIERCKPRAWLFGHTHKWTDQVIGETRCLARPYGYPRESEAIDLKTYHEKATFEI